MSRQWEMYTREIEGKMAIVFYDHALVQHVPIPGKEHVLSLDVTLTDCKENGLPGDEDHQRLLDLDVDLETYADRSDAVYVGRVVNDGHAVFFLYSGKPAPSHRLLGSLIDSKYGLEFEVRSGSDAEGKLYHEYLFPDAVSWLMIQNSHMFDYLASQGDSLERERRIDHFLYFKTEAGRDRMIENLSGDGFQVDSVWYEPGLEDSGETGSAEPTGEEEADGGLPYGLRVFHFERPEFSALVNLSVELFARAAELEGYYVRWQSDVVRS